MAERYNFKYLPLVGKLPGKSMIEQTETAINELASVVYDNVGYVGNLAEEVQTANTNASNALDKATEALETSGRVYIKQIAAVDVNDYYDSELYYINNDGSTNIPVRDRGFLEVKTNDDKTACEQVYIADSTGTPYYRHGRITEQTLGEKTTYSVTWSGWSSQPASKAYVDEKVKYIFDNFGAPLTASTVAEMTMQNRVYVYTGSETGYTAGHWYYWNGSAWTDGGVYNAVAIVTDTTLTQAGVPADAKATGDAISAIEDELSNTNAELEVFDRSPLKPLICETKARCLWQTPTTPSVFESCVEDGWNGNAWFSVSGKAGDSFVTVGSGGNANMSDISAEKTWWSAVISTDGVHYKTCLAYYIDDTTLGVYPAVEKDFVNGVVGALWRTDSMHLTKRGYIAFAQAMWSQNPKHCEKGSLIAQYIAGDTVPFTTIGGTMYASTRTANPWQQTRRYWYATQPKAYYKCNTATFATTGKRGVSWSVNAKGKRGYVEVLIAGMPSDNLDIPLGNEVHIDLYADNVLVDSYTKTTNIIEDVCLDFEKSQNLVLEIYLLNQAASEGNGSGFNLSSIQVFENQNNYGTDLIKSGTVIGQMFDSWGVHQNEATAKEFSRLINEKTGVTVPYTNHSLGSQTSAWGKAWFYENVWKYNPSVAIIDFCINDLNSMSSTGFPATVAGPDGTLYDNLISLDDYIANMKILTNEARSNGIQLIIMPPHRSYNGTWYTRLCAEIE